MIKVGDLVNCPAVVSESPANLDTPAYLGVVISVGDALAEVAGGHDIDGIVNWQGKQGQTLWGIEELTVVGAR